MPTHSSSLKKVTGLWSRCRKAVQTWSLFPLRRSEHTHTHTHTYTHAHYIFICVFSPNESPHPPTPFSSALPEKNVVSFHWAEHVGWCASESLAHGSRNTPRTGFVTERRFQTRIITKGIENAVDCCQSRLRYELISATTGSKEKKKKAMSRRRIAWDLDSCFCRSRVMVSSHWTLKTSPLAQQLVPVHSLSSADYDYWLSIEHEGEKSLPETWSQYNTLLWTTAQLPSPHPRPTSLPVQLVWSGLFDCWTSDLHRKPTVLPKCYCFKIIMCVVEH